MESGACSDILYFEPKDAEAQGDALAAAVGCTGPAVLACMRARRAEDLAAALPEDVAGEAFPDYLMRLSELPSLPSVSSASSASVPAIPSQLL